MGRCSATEVFDPVACLLLDPDSDLSTENIQSILERLIVALEDYDWDCQQDSEYYNHPTVQKIMRKLHPKWFED
ncbi:MAG: hypothetical protein V1755_05750 [Chloroflexota bacterium]